MHLQPATLAKIESVIPRYAQKRGALLPLLHLIQEDQKHIPADAIDFLAGKLGLPKIQVLETLSFYPMFKDKPLGRHHIKICRTLSCQLRGAEQTRAAFQSAFDNLPLDTTSADGEVTIELVECLAACDKAPVVQINETLHENVTPEKAAALAAKIKNN
jgi:NADH-quinone oxidoreductase subunit E